MRFKTGLIVGAAVGYYFGARAGRERYEQIERALRPLRESDRWHDVEALVRTLADDLITATKQAVKDATAPDPPQPPVRRVA